ncbi:MAG TPA: acyl-CoA thioesterase [Prolixibacteraceae bacterium]|nr:acyl-CoA thioesterase [Prolixibacteraceae bacterium]
MQKLTFEEKIYTYHIDFVGHVNNINYITWMENGRVKLFEAAGISITDLLDKHNTLPIITETFIQYKRALFLNNQLRIEAWVSQINNASAILQFRFYNEKDELCTSGHQKGSFINSQTMRPIRISEALRIAFEKFLIQE